MEKLIITPKTKVLQLIEAYPDLEDILISHVPEFKKLKNPILRKTIAKIATLQQAAGIGSIDVSELINILRKNVGQELMDNRVENPYTIKQPSWFDTNKIKQELDVREMLSKGEHPVNQVMSDLQALPPDSIYKMTASFLPAPLIDKASSLQFVHWVQKESETIFHIYFFK